MAENVRGQKNTMDECEDRMHDNHRNSITDKSVHLVEKDLPSTIQLATGKEVKRQEGLEGRAE